jgi:hypothetical protein
MTEIAQPNFHTANEIIKAQAQRITELEALAAAPPAPVVKGLDLSSLLRHAFLSGRADMAWVDYDPAECPAYERIRSALVSPPALLSHRSYKHP